MSRPKSIPQEENLGKDEKSESYIFPYVHGIHSMLLLAWIFRRVVPSWLALVVRSSVHSSWGIGFPWMKRTDKGALSPLAISLSSLSAMSMPCSLVSVAISLTPRIDLVCQWLITRCLSSSVFA